jgi:hypothetical protein
MEDIRQRVVEDVQGLGDLALLHVQCRQEPHRLPRACRARSTR